MTLNRIAVDLSNELQALRFGPPVAQVYNPLEYAAEPHRQYVLRFGKRPKETVLVGMNPGPWGMAQTGIPFGEISAVRDWMEIKAPVGQPRQLHPRRPVLGFDCTRREVSGQRLWGWARKNFVTAELFFRRFFVANYCPLMFMGDSGANLTPDKLKTAEARQLFAACDHALRRTITYLKPAHVVGIGQFAAQRARIALEGLPPKIGGITHPSPANPKANRGWESLATLELAALGIRLEPV
ncbi:MAG: single-stranded DNA-binding protein [Desulfobacterales bacterium]|jgi:single-strand selective monofunctional uracil DNA glycosylase|nr:single-stranded DNA-binding protein [Desulfobacterales bacterium]